MKRKLVTALFIGTVAAMTAASGCGKEGSGAKAAVEAPTATPEPTRMPTATPTPSPVPVKTMGEKVQGAYEILLKNATGKAISGVSVKSQEETEYQTNLLMQNDSFAASEERILFYKASGEKNADGQVQKQTYSVQLTFADNTEAVLHDFPFGDMTKAEIHMEDDVVYLTYVSANTNAPVSTKAAEIMAAAEAQATPTPTPAAAGNTVSQQTSGQGSSTPSYDDDYNTGGSTGGGDTGGGSTDGGNNGGSTDDGNNGGSTDGGNTGGSTDDEPAINGGDDSNGGNNGGGTDDGPAINGGDDSSGNDGGSGGTDTDGGGNDSTDTGGGSTDGGNDGSGTDSGDDGGHSDIVEQ